MTEFEVKKIAEKYGWRVKYVRDLVAELEALIEEKNEIINKLCGGDFESKLRDVYKKPCLVINHPSLNGSQSD